MTFALKQLNALIIGDGCVIRVGTAVGSGEQFVDLFLISGVLLELLIDLCALVKITTGNHVVQVMIREQSGFSWVVIEITSLRLRLSRQIVFRG